MELGTHTARLLVARVERGGGPLEALARERVYVRLAEGFGREGPGMISAPAVERAVRAVKALTLRAERSGARGLNAVATGLVREAANRGFLAGRIEEETGVGLRVISGREEAEYTAKGIISALGRPSGSYVLFDLGGGSTELTWERGGELVARSLAIGAAVLTERFLPGDPPSEEALGAAGRYVESILASGLPGKEEFHPGPEIIGSGGTVTTLAAMVYEVDPGAVSPDAMNGLVLEKEALEEVYRRVIALPEEERAGLEGLDPGRARVISAGTLAVLGILQYFGTRSMRVCLSDILEGLLLDDIGTGGEGLRGPRPGMTERE